MVTLAQSFLYFLVFYAIYTPVSTLLLFHYIKDMERELQMHREELFKVKRKIYTGEE